MSSAAFLNLGWSKNGVLGNGLSELKDPYLTYHTKCKVDVRYGC